MTKAVEFGLCTADFLKQVIASDMAKLEVLGHLIQNPTRGAVGDKDIQTIRNPFVDFHQILLLPIEGPIMKVGLLRGSENFESSQLQVVILQISDAVVLENQTGHRGVLFEKEVVVTGYEQFMTVGQLTKPLCELRNLLDGAPFGGITTMNYEIAFGDGDLVIVGVGKKHSLHVVSIPRKLAICI
jgi:hypothetical protein